MNPDDAWPAPIGLCNVVEPTSLELALDNVRTALRILERVHAGRQRIARLDSVAWRLADALVYLGDVADDLPGVHHPTGLQKSRGVRS